MVVKLGIHIAADSLHCFKVKSSNFRRALVQNFLIFPLSLVDL